MFKQQQQQKQNNGKIRNKEVKKENGVEYV